MPSHCLAKLDVMIRAIGGDCGGGEDDDVDDDDDDDDDSKRFDEDIFVGKVWEM